MASDTNNLPITTELVDYFEKMNYTTNNLPITTKLVDMKKANVE